MPNDDDDDNLPPFVAQALDLIARDVGSSGYDGTPQPDDNGRLLSILSSATRRQITAQDHASELRSLCSTAHERMKFADSDPTQSYAWRRLYTDAAFVWAMLDCLHATT